MITVNLVPPVRYSQKEKKKVKVNCSGTEGASGVLSYHEDLSYPAGEAYFFLPDISLAVFLCLAWLCVCT